MKKILLFIFLLAFCFAHGQKTVLQSYGIKLALPYGWTISNDEGTYTCYAPNNNAAIMIVEDEEHSLAYYSLALRYGVDFGDGVVVKTQGNLISLTSYSAYSEVLIMSANGNVKGWGGILQTKSGGVIGFLAIANEQGLNDTKAKMLAMISSCEEISRNEFSGNSQNIKAWFTILTNNHLEGNFDSYNSGYNSGGSYSSSSFDFCPNGTYTYTSEFVSSISEPSVKKTYGRWKLAEDAGSVVLITTTDNGDTYEYNLSRNGNVLYLNKSKYLIGEYRPSCY